MTTLAFQSCAPILFQSRLRCAQLLQQHYMGVVEPAVEVSPLEAASCARGLAALTRAVEDRVTAALAASISYLAAQARAPASPASDMSCDTRPLVLPRHIV